MAAKTGRKLHLPHQEEVKTKTHKPTIKEQMEVAKEAIEEVLEEEVKTKTHKPTIKEQMEVAKEAIEEVLDGNELMQFVSSPPGIGKTYMLRKLCRDRGINLRLFSPANIHALVKFLWISRNEKVLILDDADVIAYDRAMANILKMAMGPTREVVFNTVEVMRAAQRNAESDEEVRDRSIPTGPFKVKCGLIWLSNLDLTDPKKNLKASMLPHFEALCSRGLDPIYVRPADDEDLFNYIMELATTGNMLRANGFKVADQEKGLKTFIENRNHLKELSPRYLSRLTTKVSQGKSVKSMLDSEPRRKIKPYKIPKLVKSFTGKYEWR